jgi:hypothetical protein
MTAVVFPSEYSFTPACCEKRLYEILIHSQAVFAAILFPLRLYLSCRGGVGVDTLYLGILIALFIISWLFMKLIERV